jgi:hypothetical protein
MPSGKEHCEGSPGCALVKTFPRRIRRTADPSPPLRSGRDDKKERVVERKGRLLEEGAVAGGRGGCWRKGRLLDSSKDRAYAKGGGPPLPSTTALSIKR